MINAPAINTQGALATQVSSLLKHNIDREWTGHAYDILEEMREAFTNEWALLQDIEAKLDGFARKTGTAQMYVHFLVTNKQPDLQNYDPSQVFIYDGLSNSGIDFSTADIRMTIYGTVMTSVNMTDLDAYFKAGQKRQLVVHFGTDKNQDLNALENMLAQLPTLLQAAGMSAEQITAVLASIKQGNFPPALLKSLHIVSEVSQLKAARTLTPEMVSNIQSLAKSFISLMPIKHGAASILLQAMTKLTPLMKAIAMNPHRPINLKIQPSNNNKTNVPDVIKAIRALSRDKKTLTPTQRRELASVLRDLRAGLKANPMRMQTGLTRLKQLIVQNPQIKNLANIARALQPTTHTRSVHVKNVVKSIRALSRDKKNLSPAQRRELASMLRDLRAGLKANPMRAQAGITRLRQFMAQNPQIKGLANIARALQPSQPTTHTRGVDVKNAVKSIRALSRDKKNLSPAQRRELASVLRDLRASLNANPMRAQTGFTSLRQFMAQNPQIKGLARGSQPRQPTRHSTSTIRGAFKDMRASAFSKTESPAPRLWAPRVLTDRLVAPFLHIFSRTTPTPSRAPASPSGRPDIAPKNEASAPSKKTDTAKAPVGGGEEPPVKTDPKPSGRPDTTPKDEASAPSKKTDSAKAPVGGGEDPPVKTEPKFTKTADGTEKDNAGSNTPEQEKRTKVKDGPPPESPSKPAEEADRKQAPDIKLDPHMQRECCKPENIQKARDGNLRQEDVVNIFGKEIAAQVTVEQAREFIISNTEATQTLNRMAHTSVNTADTKYQQETDSLMTALLKKAHICGPFCWHAKGRKKSNTTNMRMDNMQPAPNPTRFEP